MLIHPDTVRHWIDHFYGYGTWSAKIWFVALEEGGGELPEEVADKLNYFHQLHGSDVEPTLCDIRDLYRHVNIHMEGPRAASFSTLHDYRFGAHAVSHGVWKNLIAFISGYRRQPLPDLLAHQKNSFASHTGSEALIRLYPLPSPHSHAWYYSWLDMPQLPFLKSRALYEEQVYPQRIRTLLHQIRVHRPELVLMYGMQNINRLKTSVRDHFSDTKFTMIKAVKQQIPQHHRADINGTAILITTQIPALRHNRVETGFDWRAFGESCIPPTH